MKEPILKAVASPPKLFLAPFLLGLANLGIQFPLMFILMAMFGTATMVNFIFTIPIVHMVLIGWGTKEPHLSTMVQTSKIAMRKTNNLVPYRGSKYSP